MQIQHYRDTGKGFFYIGEMDKPLAKMTYTMAGPEKMIIEHTEVGDELRGKKAGYQMVITAVEYARHNHIKIIPLCPFANSVFKKNLELRNVLLS